MHEPTDECERDQVLETPKSATEKLEARKEKLLKQVSHIDKMLLLVAENPAVEEFILLRRQVSMPL
jgi:hypothetical protein